MWIGRSRFRPQSRVTAALVQREKKAVHWSEKWAIAIPWLLTLVTAGIGLYQFGEQERDAARRPFLEKQLAACEEAAQVAASLATETDPAKWEVQRQKFWTLYWGRMALFENPVVEARMVQFGIDLPPGPVSQSDLPMRSLTRDSLEVAHAARDLISQSWDVTLLPLPLRGEDDGQSSRRPLP